MTNELGHQRMGDTTTLGAYRRGNRLPWIPSALIDVWVPYARGEIATGIPSSPVFFIQTIGEKSAARGSIHCPAAQPVELSSRAGSAVPYNRQLPQNQEFCFRIQAGNGGM
jgi:hypothetical protein